MRYWYCIDNNGNKWLYEGSVAPVKYDDESLPDIANGEMTEIRIKYTAEKCE